MSPFITFLITLLYGDTLVRVALKVDRDSLRGDALEYPMEPENREQLLALLPEYIREYGPIVQAEEIVDAIIIATLPHEYPESV